MKKPRYRMIVDPFDNKTWYVYPVLPSGVFDIKGRCYLTPMIF